MAGRSSRHVWGVVIFCVALLFVSGIILPKLLSKHYFEFRSELINKTSDFDENFTISTEAAGNGINDIPRNDANKSSLAPKLVQYNGISSVKDPGTSRIPTLKRSKRQVSDEDDNEYFAWNFNFNISRYKNPSSKISNLKSDIDDSKKNRLDAAIHLSGNGPNQNYNLQKGLDSAGVFIRSVFGDGVQKLTLEETQKIDEANYLMKGNLQIGSDVQNPVTGEIAGDETRSSGPKKRGRFLFELFGFGRTSTIKPGQSNENVASGSPTEPSSISMLSDNETNFSTGKDNFQPASSQVDLDGSTINFRTETPVSESEQLSLRSLSCGNEDKCSSPSILNQVSEVALEIFQNITVKEECENCELSFSNAENETVDNFDQTVQFSIHSFTSERLEDFCMDLVHKLGESRIFLSDKDNSKEVGNAGEDNLSTPSEVNIGCFNLMGSSEEKSKPDHSSIENAFLVTTDTSSNSSSAKDTERDARIFSWFQFGLGSGMSELDQQIPEESINTFSSNALVKDAEREARIFDLSGFGSGRSGFDAEVAENIKKDSNELNTKTEREPNVKDCISYFRKNQNIMFPKPNLMDIISDKNIEIADIANATISPKLKEQQIKFIIDLLESSVNNCALEKDGRVVENAQALGEKGKFTPEESSTGGKLAGTSTEVLIHTSGAAFKSKNTRVTMDDETGEEILQTTDIYRSERFFGFGSGDISPETDLRFMSAIKSEERLQKHPDTSEISTEDLSTRHTDCAERIDTECKSDGFVANAPVENRNCNDSGCHSEIEILQIPPSNEGDCLDDCFSFHNDSYISQINGNISYSKTEFNERNLTYLNENALGLCDDCSSSTEGLLDEDVEITENSLKIKSETFTKSRNRGNDCDDCDDENPPEKKIESDSVPRKIASTSNSRSFESTESVRNLEISEFQAVETGNADHAKIVENITKLRDILDLNANQNSSRRFWDSVILSGSGDGSLSGDTGERINMTVDNSESPQKLPQRRGRLDDETEINRCDECVDLSDALGNRNITTETVRDDPTLVTSENSDIDGKGLKFRIDPSEGRSNQTVSLTKVLNESFSTEVFSKSILDYSDVLTTVEPQPRFCISASECNGELNERCVTTSSFSSICSCARAFVRNRISGKCVTKSSYKTDLKLPAEKFEKDLGDPLTRRYKRKQDDANKLMYYLLKDNPHLVPIMAEVTFTGFSPGSLILSWDMVLAAENVSEEKMASLLQKDLNGALHDAGLKEKVPFNVSNAHVLSVSNSMDPCMSTELSYCHKNSLCVRNRFLPGGFRCRCKEDYLDVSFNSEYPGEICEALCSSDYCGNHGECIWTPGAGRHCICGDWYFGDRCGISGKVVVAGFSANIFMFMILVLVLVICKTRRRSRSYGRNRRGSTEFGTHAIAAGRVSDVIAMEENIGTKVAKISHISTPVHNVPVITIVRPTLSESSVSLYDDSTFDVTPTSESDQRNSEREPVN